MFSSSLYCKGYMFSEYTGLDSLMDLDVFLISEKKPNKQNKQNQKPTTTKMHLYINNNIIYLK